MNASALVLAALLLVPTGASAQAGTDGGTLFDGSIKRGVTALGPVAPGQTRGVGVIAGAAPGPDESASAVGLDAKQSALLAELMKHVELKPGGDPRAPAVLNETMRRLVRTPTGAEMAQRFIAENARAIVQFGGVEDAAVTMVNGKAVLLYSGGNTDTSKRPPVVWLNPGYLNADPTWRGPELADTLGHEMFGHGLECQRADAAGVSGNSLNHYRGDEANAGILGWLIGLEAGGPADNGHMWTYLRDPEAYHKNLETTMGYYAGTFSVEDMKDPLATLKTRRDRIDAARARLQDQRKETDGWRPVAEHFISVHGISRDRFTEILENIDHEDAYAVTEDQELERAQKYIDSLSAHWRTDGAAELETIKRDSSSAYYAGTEQRLEVLRERLKEETANRKPESSVPPLPNQTSFEEMARMYEQDKKVHPENWPQ